MAIDLTGVQEYVISYGPHALKKVKDMPRNYIKDIMEKAPNKRGKTESLIYKEINYALTLAPGSECDCTHTQACKLCANSKGIDWSIIEEGVKNQK